MHSENDILKNCTTMTFLRPVSSVLLFCFVALAKNNANVAAFESNLYLTSKKSSYRKLRNRSEISIVLFASDETEGPPRYRPGSLMDATIQQGRVPCGEESRKYRRTVYTHIDWVQHRNTQRITENLKGIFFSGIVRQSKSEVMLVTAVSVAIVLLNNSEDVEISLPSLPFQLSSPALGLILVFRTNASYARWSEARAIWARIISNCVNLVRMASTFIDIKTCGTQQLQHLSDAAWLFCRTLMNQLSGPEDEEEFDREMRQKIVSTSLVKRTLESPNLCMATLAELSLALDQISIDEKRRVEMDKSIVILSDCLSSCFKIYNSPVPLVYTRHTARILSLWMILLPAALYEPFANEETAGMLLFEGFSVIPTVAIVALFLFGIEELAVQLEEPFGILPMQKFCDEVNDSCRSLINWCIDSS
jgi:predicted membrane chloride channel (bestrophin family)